MKLKKTKKIRPSNLNWVNESWNMLFVCVCVYIYIYIYIYIYAVTNSVVLQLYL